MSEPGSGNVPPPRHRARRRRPTAVLVALVVVIAVAAGAYGYSQLLPSPAAVVARMRQAAQKVTELSCVLRAPWPEAYPPLSISPGARVLLGPDDSTRVWSVKWRASSGFRAEVTQPPGSAGTVTVANGEGWWVYSPLLGLALTGTGAPPPLFLAGVVEMLASGSDLRVTGKSAVSGRKTVTVSAALAGANELVVDVDRATWLPLNARLRDQTGRTLASLEVSNIDLSPGLTETDFSFEPPEGTRVLAGALPRTYRDVASAAADLPFGPQLPGRVPEGFRLAAVNVTGQGASRALVVTWTRPVRDGAGAEALLSFTQALAGAGYSPLPYGRPEERADLKARVFELGEMRIVDWRLGELACTLFGTISYFDLLDVAASIR